MTETATPAPSAADPAVAGPAQSGSRRWRRIAARSRRGWRWPSAQLPPPVDRTPARYLLGGLLLLLIAALLQRPGAIVADTKVALALNPVHFLGHVLHLWDPTSDSGMVSNQSTGYLMPMGPFFLITHGLGIPTAVAQRFWLTFVLGAAFWGAVRLGDALGIGNRAGRLLGGLAYALSPVMLSRAGDNSALLLGGAFLPWMLLPLVRATWTRHLPPDQRHCSTRRVAALSGCAVLLAGGINATVTLNVLIAPALWLVLMCRGRRAWALRGWWILAVICATAWWALALRMQGAYGIDFVRYTENSATTTSVTSLPETLRGTADWLGFLRVRGLGIPAAWLYISAPVVVGSTFALLGFGLLGLGRRQLPARRFLLASLLIGVVAVAAAYPGTPHGIFSSQWRDALGGSLSALRNVTKFQPLIRLPLALGLAHCLPVLARARPDAGRLLRIGRHAVRTTVPLALAAAVVIGAAPLLLSRTYPEGSFTSVPSYWKKAAAWLNSSATGSRTLLLPATPTGKYTWGAPSDEPMMWLSHTDWAVRNLIPLGGVNSTRLLDGIEQELEQRSAPHLAEALARSGIGFVLVRNDLPADSADLPPSTYEVHAALYGSGLRRVASFGPLTRPRPSALQQLTEQRTNQARFPALEVYETPAAARKVDSYPLSQLAVLSGGSEAIPTLTATGVLGNRPTVTASDLADPAISHTTLPRGTVPSTWIDTDTLQRRDEQFGAIHNSQSYLLAAGGSAAGTTGAPQRRLDVPADGHETVARYTGIKDVTASGYGFVLAGVPQQGPQAAIDGNVFTAWSVSGYPHDNVGQWWQITFPAKRNLNSLQVSLLAESKKRSRITKLRVSTQAGSRVSTLRNTEDLQQIKVPAGPTSWLRLTILSVTKGTDELYGPGLREVTVPGLPITSVAALPDDAQKFFSGAGPSNQTFVLTRDRDDPLAALDTDPEQQLARRFVVQRGADFAVRGTAVASTGFQLPAGATAKPNLNLACGTGPTIMIDGHPYPTALHGSPYSYTSGQPVDMWLCDLRPIHLSAGPHTIRSVPGYLPLRVATMTITSLDAQPSASTATRQGTPRKWGNEHRRISLPAGPAVVLTVHENFNASWSATLDGRRLSPIRVDGWQQGFVVPAGPAGTVVLTNSPGIALQRQLIVAAALVLLLLLAAAIPARRLRPAPTAARDLPQWLGAVAGVGAAALALLFTAGPAVAAAVPAAGLLVWLTRRAAPLLLIGVLAAATVLEVTEHQHFVASGQGAFSPAAQICVAAALGLGVLLSVPVLRPRPRQDGPETPACTATDQPHGQSASPAQDL